MDNERRDDSGVDTEKIRLPLVLDQYNPGYTVTMCQGDYDPDFTSLSEFLEGAKAEHTYRNMPVLFAESDDMFLFIDGAGVYAGQGMIPTRGYWTRRLQSTMAFAVSGAIAEHKSGKVLLVNGDEDDCSPEYVLNHFSGFDKYPTISFVVLGLLLGLIESDDVGEEGVEVAEDINGSSRKISEMFQRGRLVLLDYTGDSTLPVSSNLRRKLQRQLENDEDKLAAMENRETPPEPGYTLLRIDDYEGDRYTWEWHRSSTCLISYRPANKKGPIVFLLGQDEDTYFGCELADCPAEIKRAFTSLMPKNLRGKKDIIRQGEWFAAPVKEDQVPSITECAAFAEYSDEESLSSGMILPVDDPDANRHLVHADGYNDFVAIVDRKGQVFARDFAIEHVDTDGEATGEHEDLLGKPGVWYTFHHNTAVRSFSAGGVD